jgi:hypothetical protein
MILITSNVTHIQYHIHTHKNTHTHTHTHTLTHEHTHTHANTVDHVWKIDRPVQKSIPNNTQH